MNFRSSVPCNLAPKFLRTSSRRRPRHASRPFPSLSLSSPAPRLAGCIASKLHFCRSRRLGKSYLENCLARWASEQAHLPFGQPRDGVRGKLYHKHDFASSVFLEKSWHHFFHPALTRVFLCRLERKKIFTLFCTLCTETQKPRLFI